MSHLSDGMVYISTYHFHCTINNISGNFTERVGALTMRDCIGKCCDDTTCDLAFMFGESCYSVECRNEKLCQAVLAKPSQLEPKVSYVTRGYLEDKDKGMHTRFDLHTD